MGHTMAEKIIAAHCLDGRLEGVSSGRGVRPGDHVEARVDLILANDITGPIAIREFQNLSNGNGLLSCRVFDPERIALVADHFTPSKDIKSAEQCQIVRKFADAQGLSHYYDGGRAGIEHVLLPEQGLVAPGELVVGADSHTCTYGALGAFATGMGSTDVGVAMATGNVWLRVPETIRLEYRGKLQPWVGGKDLILDTIARIGVSGALYRAIEFTGPVMDELPMAGRFTMANMAIEAGAKVGLFAVDQATCAYLDDRVSRSYTACFADEDADYEQILDIDVTDLGPVVALPHRPDNVCCVSEAAHVSIDQSVIGSCTNGRIDDLRIAAEVLRGQKVAQDVRCIVIPGTPQVYLDALREGLLEIFVEAGAVVSTPTCGPCLGGHMGVLAAGERAVSTTNRNFQGRMGHADSEIYLAGPAVAAASAIAGRIAHPDEVWPGRRYPRQTELT